MNAELFPYRSERSNRVGTTTHTTYRGTEYDRESALRPLRGAREGPSTVDGRMTEDRILKLCQNDLEACCDLMPLFKYPELGRKCDTLYR